MRAGTYHVSASSSTRHESLCHRTPVGKQSEERKRLGHGGLAVRGTTSFPQVAAEPQMPDCGHQSSLVSRILDRLPWLLSYVWRKDIPCRYEHRSQCPIFMLFRERRWRSVHCSHVPQTQLTCSSAITYQELCVLIDEDPGV